MKLLTLFRHAKSTRDPAYPVDHERPLAARGREDAALMGRMMARAAVVPQLIVASPSKRTRETAKLFAPAAGYKGPISIAESIYLGETQDLLEIVLALPAEADHVMLIGHNPGFEMFASLLLGAPPDASGLRMPTAAMAHFVLPVTEWAQVAPGQGLLLWLITPGLIRDLK